MLGELHRVQMQSAVLAIEYIGIAVELTHGDGVNTLCIAENGFAYTAGLPLAAILKELLPLLFILYG